MTAAIEVAGLGVTLGGARVLDGVDLTLDSGSWLAVVGPNGAGKSTLLRALTGLVRHDGTVTLGGRHAGSLRPRDRARLAGYAPQAPVLPAALSVTEYVLLGRTPYRSLLSAPRAEDRTVTAGVLERLDLGPFRDRPLHTLSGGERQRAVLARALAQQPRMLFLDEPTSALDLGHAQQVLELVDRLRREDGLTVVSTLHDLTLAGQYADTLLMLAGGAVVATGSPADVLTPERLARHYGATAEVTSGPEGIRVYPVRRRPSPS
ncbi:MAG: cobalamin transport system ATP-binding protein [Actinomycetota bacterium]|nr:cobalamin transport system ATP-binding protein [Actinomycetota bacterium]